MAAPIKVLSVVGTRPEAIKLFPLIHALESDIRFHSRVCATGQHRELLDQVLTLAGISPDYDLCLMREGQTLDDLTARALTAIGKVLDREQPDWVVVQGDTTSAMAGALAAHYRRIAVCHVEAGLRSGDLHHPWPEEANRRIIATLASLHCAPTRNAADALMSESIDPATIHVTGNTVIDALYWMRDRLAAEPELASTMHALERRFEGKAIIGVTAHRRENLDGPLEEIANALEKIAERDDVAIIFPIHPNPQVRDVMAAKLGQKANVALVEPLDYPNFVRLMDVATLMLTDSGGVQEEAPALGTPVLVMREKTERVEACSAGKSLLVGRDRRNIVAEVDRILCSGARCVRSGRLSSPFGNGSAAREIHLLLARQAPK